ncbi:MAG: DUF2461 domain-containing protein [Bacteroidetes bacterium]|nr:DUF2461 domain-containing protein [Bacteroidota bacterium]MBM3424270.1 DUF2461 domain-containing protein [Bacteroidota bacterium]
MPYFSQEYLNFFMELASNNHKEWFDRNRFRYENHVKKPFSAFTQALIDRLSENYPVFNELLAKDCIFRINRDIRFSNDKTPYKLMCSAVIAPGGKKSTAINGIYFEFSPEHLRVYGGVYEIDKEQLQELREGIAAHASDFKNLITQPEFVEFFGEIRGEKNKVLPADLKDFAIKQPLLYNKQFYFFTTFPTALLLGDQLLETLLKAYEIGKPVETFFNQFIHRK